MTNLTTTAPAAQAPVEAALFEALNTKGGEAELIAFDHWRKFGADVADMADEVAEALYPKAVDFLAMRGERRGHDWLWGKCRKWAAFWCQHYADREQWKRDRADAIDREAADRLAYNLDKYGGWDGFARGWIGSLAKRRGHARDNARRCSTLRRCGWTLARIAAALGIDKRTVQRHLAAHAARIAEARIVARAVELVRWTFGKGRSVQTKTQDRDLSTEQPLPTVHLPQIAAAAPEPPPPAARDVDKMDVIGELMKHWRADNVDETQTAAALAML